MRFSKKMLSALAIAALLSAGAVVAPASAATFFAPCTRVAWSKSTHSYVGANNGCETLQARISAYASGSSTIQYIYGPVTGSRSDAYNSGIYAGGHHRVNPGNGFTGWVTSPAP